MKKQTKILDNITNFLFVQNKTIYTKRLCLRRPMYEDFDELLPVLSDKDVSAKMLDLPYDEDKIHELLDFADNEWNFTDATELDFCIVYESKVIGLIQISSVDDTTFEIGWILGKDYWNRGICTEAALPLIELLEYFGARSIKANCDSTNIASWKVMEKLGMKRVCEGDYGNHNKLTPDVPRIDYYYELNLPDFTKK